MIKSLDHARGLRGTPQAVLRYLTQTKHIWFWTPTCTAQAIQRMPPIKHTPYPGNLTSSGFERIPGKLDNYRALTNICRNIRRAAREFGHDMSMWTDEDILALEDYVDDPELDEFLLQM
jgi:hypothetical protein